MSCRTNLRTPFNYLSRRWCSFSGSTARMPHTRTDVRWVSLEVDPSFADTARCKLLRTFRSSRCRRRPRCPGQRMTDRAGLEGISNKLNMISTIEWNAFLGLWSHVYYTTMSSYVSLFHHCRLGTAKMVVFHFDDIRNTVVASMPNVSMGIW